MELKSCFIYNIQSKEAICFGVKKRINDPFFFILKVDFLYILNSLKTLASILIEHK